MIEIIVMSEVFSMATNYGSYKDFEGYSLDEIREFDEDDQVRIITDWFDEQFEDPQNDTPYNNDAGGYVYLWGGPFDASDQIQEEFSNVIDFDTMMRAVEEVQASGVVEWAPQTNGDFYEHPEEEDRVAAGEIIDGDGDWPPLIPDEQDVPPEPEARLEVIQRIDELEALIQPLIDRLQDQRQPPPMMGHNNPPEQLEGYHGISRDEWLHLRDTIEGIKTQTNSEAPDTEALNQSGNTFMTAAANITEWVAQKLNAAVDAVVGAGAVGGVIYAYNNPEVVIAALTSAAQAVGTWISSLPMAF